MGRSWYLRRALVLPGIAPIIRAWWAVTFCCPKTLSSLPCSGDHAWMISHRELASPFTSVASQGETKDLLNPYSAPGFLRCLHNAARTLHHGASTGSEHRTALPAR